MPTLPVFDGESRRRKEAIEKALREGANPFNHNLGGKFSSVQVAARSLGLADSTMNAWLRRQIDLNRLDKPNFMPDWSLFNPAPGSGDPLDLGRRILGSLKSSPSTLEELAERLDCSPSVIDAALDQMRDAGAAIFQTGEKLEVVRQHAPSWTGGHSLSITTDANNRLNFGAVGDNHAGSKYTRWDVVDDLFDRFEQAGIKHVFHTGNWIDGEASFNRYDIDVIGLDSQCRDLAQRWPQKEGVETHAVWGDDHEGWYASREGIDVGRYAASTFRNEGRDDWHDLGFMEAHVEIVNANSGKSCTMAVIHPGGGSSYAVSYRVQKIVESMEGGQKPAIMLCGHLHKMQAMNIRNVWTLQTGCCQDQTPFLRKKSIEAHIGGTTVSIEQDPETGAIVEFVPAMRRYFVKGYYAGRDQWSKHGPTKQPPRSIGGV